MATPFVQGQLRFDPLSFTIDTQCAHCARPIQIEIDGQLDYRVLQQDADPLVFVPLVDFAKLDDPSIIDAF
jgi:hypothetical protein